MTRNLILPLTILTLIICGYAHQQPRLKRHSISRNDKNKQQYHVNPRKQTNHQLLASSNTPSPTTSSSSSTSSSPLSTPFPKKLSKKSIHSFQLNFFSIFLPFLYFFCTSMNIPNLPKYINWIMNQGDSNVSANSAQVYGNIAGIDAFFTFLSVNFIGVLSDRYGRKPFMILSTLGLGFAYFITSISRESKFFYLAAAIDGLTSCMLSQSQSLIADLASQQRENDNDLDGTESNPDNNDISIALSRFQGFAIGFAFMFGIPFGGILSAKYSYRLPIQIAVVICLLNSLLITIFIPSGVQHSRKPTENILKDNQPNEGVLLLRQKDSSRTGVKSASAVDGFEWSHANPLNAISLLFKNKKVFYASMAYLFIQFSQSGLQINWINYLQYRFGWSGPLSGSTLMVIGIVIAVLPPIFIPLLGIKKAIQHALILHFISLIFLASTNSGVGVFAGMPFLSAGASAMPMLLGYLTDQVGKNEIGALQGAADALRTLSTMIGSPLFAKVFGYFISKNRNFPSGALYFSSSFSLISFLFFLLSVRN